MMAFVPTSDVGGSRMLELRPAALPLPDATETVGLPVSNHQMTCFMILSVGCRVPLRQVRRQSKERSKASESALRSDLERLIITDRNLI
ncbi:MAG: hypothetical protein PHV74_10290 [Dehalococcoidia bacterium]|nr:hypothetical protein [Dehalococcoidia bacterium]